MLERACSRMTCRALPCVFVAEVDRVLELTIRRRYRFSAERLIDRGVAHSAVIPNDAAVIARMLAVVTPKTALGVIVAYVVRMRLPVGLHLGEEVRLIKLLHLGDGVGDTGRLR